MFDCCKYDSYFQQATACTHEQKQTTFKAAEQFMTTNNHPNDPQQTKQFTVCTLCNDKPYFSTDTEQYRTSEREAML